MRWCGVMKEMRFFVYYECEDFYGLLFMDKCGGSTVQTEGSTVCFFFCSKIKKTSVRGKNVTLDL